MSLTRKVRFIQISYYTPKAAEKYLLNSSKFELLALCWGNNNILVNMLFSFQVLRFGRPIGLAMTFLDLSKQLSLALSGKGKPGDVKSHPVHIACKMGSMLSLITFFLLDHILYLARVRDIILGINIHLFKCSFSNMLFVLARLT